MGTTRTLWHILLVAFLSQRAPRRFEVRSEVQLSTEPLRGDLLLIRTESAPAQEDGPRTLRRLWDLLPLETLVEFKSVSRPYRHRNLHRLWSYLYVHYSDQPKRLARESQLCGVLLVPARSPSLVRDAAALRLHWRELGHGYSSLHGGGFALYVVELDVVAEVEGDDLLSFFGHGEPHTDEAQQWLCEQLGSEKMNMALSQVEGYAEMLERVIAKLPPEQIGRIFAMLPPEKRLAGLAPEQRLADLPPDQAVLALPDEILRALPEEYIAKLPEPIRATVRARLGK
jgi:hypothetical protein